MARSRRSAGCDRCSAHMSAPARKLQPEQIGRRIVNAFADRVLTASRNWQDDAPAGEPRRLSAGSAVDLMEAKTSEAFPLSRINRDRGEPRGSSPPTPPYIRVRIRRFGGLSLPPCGRTEGRGFVSRIAAAASVPAPPGRRASPSGLGGQAGQYRSSAAWPPRDACRYSPLPPFGPSSGRPDYYALC